MAFQRPSFGLIVQLCSLFVVCLFVSPCDGKKFFMTDPDFAQPPERIVNPKLRGFRNSFSVNALAPASGVYVNSKGVVRFTPSLSTLLRIFTVSDSEDTCPMYHRFLNKFYEAIEQLHEAEVSVLPTVPESTMKAFGYDKNTFVHFGPPERTAGSAGCMLLSHVNFQMSRAWVPVPKVSVMKEPLIQDIRQGGIGDCWFLAALGSYVYAYERKGLDLLLTDNPDEGTYTVRLHVPSASTTGSDSPLELHEFVYTRTTCESGDRGSLGEAASCYAKFHTWVQFMEKAMLLLPIWSLFASASTEFVSSSVAEQLYRRAALGKSGLVDDSGGNSPSVAFKLLTGHGDVDNLMNSVETYNELLEYCAEDDHKFVCSRLPWSRTSRDAYVPNGNANWYGERPDLLFIYNQTLWKHLQKALLLQQQELRRRGHMFLPLETLSESTPVNQRRREGRRPVLTVQLVINELKLLKFEAQSEDPLQDDFSQIEDWLRKSRLIAGDMGTGDYSRSQDRLWAKMESIFMRNGIMAVSTRDNLLPPQNAHQLYGARPEEVHMGLAATHAYSVVQIAKDFQPPGGVETCRASQPGDALLKLECAEGETIGSVIFSSFGTPTGSCPTSTLFGMNPTLGKCQADPLVLGNKIYDLCLGKQQCSVDVNQDTLGAVTCDGKRDFDPADGRLIVIYGCLRPPPVVPLPEKRWVQVYNPWGDYGRLYDTRSLALSTRSYGLSWIELNDITELFKSWSWAPEPEALRVRFEDNQIMRTRRAKNREKYNSLLKEGNSELQRSSGREEEVRAMEVVDELQKKKEPSKRSRTTVKEDPPIQKLSQPPMKDKEKQQALVDLEESDLMSQPATKTAKKSDDHQIVTLDNSPLTKDDEEITSALTKPAQQTEALDFELVSLEDEQSLKDDEELSSLSDEESVSGGKLKDMFKKLGTRIRKKWRAAKHKRIGILRSKFK